MKNLKVGDRVWTIQNGWTKVVAIEQNDTYPIKTPDISYTLEGLQLTDNKHPSLFLTNPFEKFKPRFMMVSDDGKSWVKNFVVDKLEFGVITFTEVGRGYLSYNFAKEIETITLTRKEIAEKFNVDLENLIIE